MSLLAFYHTTADRFARETREILGDAVDAVVLYGSVARGRVHKGSDIDILVLADADGEIEDKLEEIGERLDYDNGFDTFIMPLCLSADRLLRLGQLGFPIAHSILTEGIALYDNGTFAQLRRRTAASRG